MRILTFTTLYPNVVRPQFGIFVETRLRHLVASGRVSARVVAPSPWFPSTSPRFGAYGAYARVPAREERHGLAIDHPRYPHIPKFGMSIAPALLFAGVLPFVRRQIAEGRDFDAIDAHYMYPDGVAAALLGQALNRPVAITCRGTDINVIPRYALPRRQILWAANRVATLITVSEGLRDRLVDLGVAEGAITVLRNGVDLTLFRPLDRSALRAKLGFTGPVLLAVGNLVELKRHDRMIAALRYLPEATLVIVGDGPLEHSLKQMAIRDGLLDRVRFLPRMAQDQLCEVYNAADVLLLASKHEGWPNVLLESMACGTPVVASKIPGVSEVVRARDAGRLLHSRDPESIATTVRELLEAPPDRSRTRRYAEGFGWESTTQGQIAIFEHIIGRSLRDGRAGL